MNSTTLATALAPFKKLVDIRAIDPIYRTLELTATRVYGQALFAQLDISVALSLKEPCFVDGATFISVVESMPSGDIQFTAAPNMLEWKCGNASGQMAQMTVTGIAKNSTRRGKSMVDTTLSFVRAMDLGSISADKNMAAAEMFGVVVDNGECAVASSDGSTIAYASFDGGKMAGAPSITLSLSAAELLSSVMTAEGGVIGYTDKGVFYQNASSNLLVAENDPLKYDIVERANKFVGGKQVVSIPRDMVAAFIKRAAAMAEIKQHTYVTLAVEKGRISLSFAEGAATTDEYHMLEKQKLPTMPPIKVNAVRMARALSHTDTMVLDFMTDNVLVLVSKDESFRYIIAGRSD